MQTRHPVLQKLAATRPHLATLINIAVNAWIAGRQSHAIEELVYGKTPDTLSLTLGALGDLVLQEAASLRPRLQPWFDLQPLLPPSPPGAEFRRAAEEQLRLYAALLAIGEKLSEQQSA